MSPPVGHKKMTMFELFDRHIDRSGYCWFWTAALKENGYGFFGARGYNGYAHRFSYEYYVGQIPDDKELDHLCRNRRCVNPVHLELVTRRVNQLRSPISVTGVNASKTSCNRGHKLDSINTRYYYAKGGSGFLVRRCRRCHADAQLRLNQRRRLLRCEAMHLGIGS